MTKNNTAVTAGRTVARRFSARSIKQRRIEELESQCAALLAAAKEATEMFAHLGNASTLGVERRLETAIANAERMN